MTSTDARPYRRFAAETVWVVVGQATAMIAVTVGLGVLTRFLAPEAYGQLSLALTAANLLALVVVGPVASAASRYASIIAEPAALSPLLDAARIVTTRRCGYVLAAAIVAAIIFAALGRWQPAVLALVTAAFTVLNGGTVMAESILNARRLRREVAVHRALQQSLNYVLAVAFTAVVLNTAAAALAGFALAAACTLGLEVALLRRRFGVIRQTPEMAGTGEWTERLRLYARPYERWGFFQWLQSSSDRWSLVAFADTREVGLYTIAYQLGYAPLGLLATLVSQTAEPVIYQRAGNATDSDRMQSAQQLRRLAVLAFGGVAALMFVVFLIFHRALFGFLVDDSFWPASPLLPWLTLAAALFGVAQLESVKWLARLQPERMQTGRVLSSLVGVVVITIGAWIGDATGAAAGQVVFSIVFLIWMRSLR